MRRDAFVFAREEREREREREREGVNRMRNVE